MSNFMVWFLVIWVTVLTGVYIYIGWRIVKPAKLTKRQKWIVWSIIAITPLTQPFSFFLRDLSIDPIVAIILSWISYVGFGLFSLILFGLVLRDLVLGFSLTYRKIENFISKIQHKPLRDFDPQRRSFLLNATNVGVIGAAALLTSYGIYEARRNPTLEKVVIPLPGLDSESGEFKIAQFTDIHAGFTIKRDFIASAVEQVNQLGADAIVFTGDMVDGNVNNLRGDVEPLKELEAPHGVYFVTGNHEYYSGVEAWIAEMDRLGFIVLLNEHKLILHNNTRIKLAGVTDYRADTILPSHHSDPRKAMGDADNADINILLAHQPKSIHKAAEVGFDLQISGHTHGGQYIPWSFLVTLDQPFVKGLHRYQNTWIYVSRGTGYWGPPLRIGIPSEVTLFTLTNS